METAKEPELEKDDEAVFEIAPKYFIKQKEKV